MPNKSNTQVFRCCFTVDDDDVAKVWIANFGLSTLADDELEDFLILSAYNSSSMELNWNTGRRKSGK